VLLQIVPLLKCGPLKSVPLPQRAPLPLRAPLPQQAPLPLPQNAPQWRFPSLAQVAMLL
jgi:hypothetical protein